MDSIEDFHKKYTGTWVRYRSDKLKKLVPALVEAIDMADEMLMLSVREIGTLNVKYTKDTVAQLLELDPPATGFFNHNGHALVLFKTPARQWRRGFCSENHEIYNPFRKILKEGAYRPGFGAMTISSIFDPKYVPDPEVARRQLDNDVNSVALSRHLMLSKSPVEDKPYPLVWYNCDPVGFLRGDRFVIDDEIFHQEIEDELTRMGQSRWIS